MMTKSGFNAESFKGLFKVSSLFEHIRLKAFAEEAPSEPEEEPETTPAEPAKKTPTVNYEELISKARAEEKAKLYPRIKKLEKDNQALLQSSNDALLGKAQAEKDLEEYKNSHTDSKQVSDLQKKVADLEAENKKLKESAPDEKKIREQVEAEYATKMYRTEQLAANKDTILDIFTEEVSGSTNEEIDASIKKAQEKTASVKKQLGLTDETGKTKKTKKSTTPPTKPSTPPVANPSEDDGEVFDADYVRNLDPRSKEYAEFRKKMGLH